MGINTALSLTLCCAFLAEHNSRIGVQPFRLQITVTGAAQPIGARVEAGQRSFDLALANGQPLPQSLGKSLLLEGVDTRHPTDTGLIQLDRRGGLLSLLDCLNGFPLLDLTEADIAAQIA